MVSRLRAMEVWRKIAFLFPCLAIGTWIEVQADCQSDCEGEIRKLCTKDGKVDETCFDATREKCEVGNEIGPCIKALSEFARLNRLEIRRRERQMKEALRKNRKIFRVRRYKEWIMHDSSNVQ